MDDKRYTNVPLTLSRDTLNTIRAALLCWGANLIIQPGNDVLINRVDSACHELAQAVDCHKDRSMQGYRHLLD